VSTWTEGLKGDAHLSDWATFSLENERRHPALSVCKARVRRRSMLVVLALPHLGGGMTECRWRVWSHSVMIRACDSPELTSSRATVPGPLR
jgi:hypothetical protein